MKYEIEIEEWVIDQLADEWKLPDSVINELSRRFDEELAVDPMGHSIQLVAPARTRQYRCDVPDPGNPRILHVFLFRFYFSADERAVIVYEGIYFAARE